MRKDFALCFNDGYVPYACVTIRSVADHMLPGDDVHVHVVSDYLSESHKDAIEKAAGDSVKVIFYLAKDDARLVSLPVHGWSIYAWYRLLLPEFLGTEVRRVLYLDCDVIVNASLDELFILDFNGKAIAASIDVQTYNDDNFIRLGYARSSGYICSGVLLMNLDKWRERRISSEAVDFARLNRDRLKWPDQDTINFVCRNDKIVLPAKYGVLVPFFIDRMFISEHMADMDELMERPAIVHYAGYQPWIYPQDKSMHSGLWWKTWRSLHAFPKVMFAYSVHFLKYILKISLIRLGIIRRGSRAYCCDMYWYHSKVRMADVRKLMEEIKGII